MCFRKQWLRLMSVNFNFSAKLSSTTDYNELNKPNPKSLVHIGSNKFWKNFEVDCSAIDFQ